MNDFLEHIAKEFSLPLQSPVLVFSLILFIILLAPILLKRLNIPGIIGLIISGVIIGPYGLHLLENSSAIKLFSTIGLLYIMFIAGLELDLNEFKTHKNRSLVFGLFTFAIPLAVGFPVCHYILGYDFNASFLTASMFATHTLVAYPIVSKFGVAKHQAVAITVGGTILTDTAVLIILAVIMGNSQGTLDQSFWLRLGVSLALFSAIMFLLIPRIAKWFFKKLESEKHAHYIFVLAVVFFAAFLAELAGVEPIIGAFIAGLALNPLIPHSSALMNRIEFMGNSLFIPFFLVSVGMLVDVRVIMSGPMAIIIALTLSVVAIAGKWLAAWLTQISFKYTSSERGLIFGLSGAHAAATLAVILVGYNAGILDENILNGTIILILITCVVASFAAEKAAKKVALEDAQNVSMDTLKSQSKSKEQILIPVSNLKLLENLLDFSLIIKDKNSQEPITLLCVVPNNETAEINILKYQKELEKYTLQGSATETKVNTVASIDHNLASGIARKAKELMADFVIMNWPENGGFFDKLFGEKAEGVINKVDRILVFCHFARPLIENKRMVLVCPPLIEKEDSFPAMVQKFIRISQEYSNRIVLYSEEMTYHAITEIMKDMKLTSKINFNLFTNWEDYLILSKDITIDDLVIWTASRRNSISFDMHLEKAPGKLEKYMPKNNLMVFYPQDHSGNSILDDDNNFSPAPLSKGIEAIEQIGKGIGSIFKRGK